MSGFTASPDSFRQLFLSDTPFLDVRAEVEFSKGTFPTSFNAPILNTNEREQVGTCYKQQGQQAAIELGHQLVSGELKGARIATWCDFARQHAGAHLYCWRGGMRSNLTQQWMAEAGVDIPLIPGGYKALRNVLIKEFEDTAANSSLVIIGGKTGTAKTPLLAALPSAIDLEHFANHRGSSFGRKVTLPPCQVDFENSLGIDLLKKRHQFPGRTLFLEDESRLIGSVSIPLPLWDAMTQSSIAVVEMPLAFRVQRVLEEYVVDMRRDYERSYPEDGFERYREYLVESLVRIRKRLGTQRHAELEKLLTTALDEQLASDRVDLHEAWIEVLLRDYYDPMYEYQLEKSAERIVFRGDYQQVTQWAQSMG